MRLLSSSSAWQSNVSINPDPFKGLEEVLAASSDDQKPDIAFLFVAQYHGGKFRDLVTLLSALLPENCEVLSVVGGGVVSSLQEYDEPSKPSLCLMTGRLPTGGVVETFSFNELHQPPPDATDSFWNKSGASYFLLADPWSPIDTVLERLDASSGNVVTTTGGISVPTGTGPTVGLGKLALPQGSVVGVRFTGTMTLQAVVSQGCRPVGPVFRVTECNKNAVLQLDHQPALQALEGLISPAQTEEEKRKISSGLVVGLSSNDLEKDDDYLIRQIAGFIPSKGGMIVGGSINVGDKFRFHVRDKDAAAEDMRLMVQRAQTEKLFSEQTSATSTPLAVLQVSCVARGRYLFGKPNVDISNIRELAGQGVAIGGFYANGELGPVGLAGFAAADESSSVAGSHMHGFTTVATVLCEQHQPENQTSATATTSNVQDPLDAWE